MLRPPSLLRHFRQPQPRQTRQVWCPGCDHLFDVSTRVLSLRCPQCGQGIAPRDLDVTASMNGDITALGLVTLPPTMRITGRLTCARLTSGGEFQGELTVGSALELEPGSKTQGTIACRTLLMHEGAQLRAQARIGTLR
jgi:hypothetical protein